MMFARKPSRRETLWGGIYLSLYMSVLPVAVSLVSVLLLKETDLARIEFIYMGLNFLFTTVIFHRYLLGTIADASRSPFRVMWYTLLAFLGNVTLSNLVTSTIVSIDPGFINVNDSAINSMVQQNYMLMAFSTVIFAPVTEELLFRGLIFRGLYDRSPLLAQVLTIVLFSLVHVQGYLGLYDLKTLFFCFLQYLPVSYCLNFAYRYSGSLVAPILVHMLNNLFVLLAMR